MGFARHIAVSADGKRFGSARVRITAALLTALCIIAPATPGFTEPDTNTPPAANQTPDPFQMLTLANELQLVASHLRLGQFSAAEMLLRKSALSHPKIAELPYTLAVILARQGKSAAALKSLEVAIQAGFGTAEALEKDVGLTPLRTEPRFAKLMEQTRKHQARAAAPTSITVKPFTVSNTTAMVDAGNTAWDGRLRVLRSFFRFAPKPAEGVLVHQGTKPVARMLNRWYARGRAAGNHGDLYDNRDRNHSNLTPGRLQQISYVEYSNAARAAGADYRLNTQIFFNAVTIGNSSLARTAGPLWRSQPRLALTDQTSVQRLYLQYANNHLYVYPEHRDHDPTHGDLFPANTPYMIISQGSSGSDQPFVHAIGAILAAFTPETKAFLRQQRLISPTVQMIFRRASRLAAADGAYFTGAAHPTVFQAQDIDLAAMIQRANALRPNEVPPRVTIRVEQENTPQQGIDHYAQISTERLFDTPSAIARVVRAVAHTKRLVVSAEPTSDPNGLPLSFRWVVLRGDAERIAITPLDDAATKSELIVPWHERTLVPGRPQLKSSRVDIAVFADNGAQVSAPAFISLYYPDTQLREYDDQGRIARIDYRNPVRAKHYADPVLFTARDWADVYDYGLDGRPTGWTRTRGTKTTRYTRHGARVLETDPQGRATKAVAVRYVLEPQANSKSKVTEHDTDKFFHYAYQDETDRHGTLAEAPQE